MAAHWVRSPKVIILLLSLLIVVIYFTYHTRKTENGSSVFERDADLSTMINYDEVKSERRLNGDQSDDHLTHDRLKLLREAITNKKCRH